MTLKHIMSKKKTTSKKCANVGGRKCRKKLLAKSAKHKQFSRVMVSMDLYGIVKTPAAHPVGYSNKLIYFGLYSIKISMVHMQRKL